MANNGEFKVDWIVPELRKPCRFCWKLASSITLAAVGIFSKLFLEFLNRTRVHNRHIIMQALDKRPSRVPLITVSNHHSCFDDPGLWVCLKWRHFISLNAMRWAIAAHDICFTNVFHSYFFMLGKCAPVVRGKGVYQEVMNFCIERLAKGEWVHVFPEGRVNMAKEFIRLKWGVGRLVYESPVVPMIIPMWHEGMENVLPNYPPYYLRTGKKVTLNFGEPLDLTSLVKELRAQNASDMEARKAITDKIQEALMKLKTVTEKLHEAS